MNNRNAIIMAKGIMSGAADMYHGVSTTPVRLNNVSTT